MSDQTQNELTDLSTLFREVLHLVAQSEDPSDTIRSLLDSVNHVMQAQGSGLFLFEDKGSHYVQGLEAANFPEELFVQALTETLTADGHYSPATSAGYEDLPEDVLVNVIRSPNAAVGLLWIKRSDLSPTSDQTEALEVLVDGLTVMANRITSSVRQRKLSRNQSEFMRIVAHDLRTPLTSMGGFVNMLEAVGELNDQQRYFVEKVNHGIEQMTSQVDNFQDAGRFDVETGFYEMVREPLDLTEIVQQIVETHLMPAEKQELTLTTKIGDNIPIVNADVVMMQRAIINLIDNAIKYTPNGRRVEVGVDVAENELRLSVADNGLGISPENQKMLFERHVRIHRPEHKRIKGSGLGLFIVRSVAQRHGGRAWVESEEGVGTTFFISIPLDGDNVIVPDMSGS
jgi:signal transduction histidine kinase